MSILNIKGKTLFIHIPKTAGTSMEKTGILGEVYNRHTPMSHFKSLEERSEDIDLDKYFKFSFVRNPYDRFASGVLNHPLKREKNIKDKRGAFNQYVLNNKEKMGEWLVTKPQHEFLYVDGKLAVDFVGRFENLQEDWEKLCMRIVGHPVDLPHLTKSGYTYEDLYSPEVKKLVREFYKEDFKLFNYDD